MGSDRDRLAIDDNQEDRLARFCLDHSSVCTFRLDREGYILYANRNACDSLGYSQAELLGMPVFDINPVMDREMWPHAWQTLCDDGSVTCESQLRRKDGTIFPVEVTETLLEFEGRRYSMALINDITDRKRVYESLRINQECLFC